MRKSGSGWVVLALLLAATSAQAEYSDDCRFLAEKLAKTPGDMKVGELDLMKNCLSSLQRGIVLGETPPPPSPLSAEKECPAPPPEKVCPVCPEATTCPKSSPASSAREKAREREAPSELRPKMYIY